MFASRLKFLRGSYSLSFLFFFSFQLYANPVDGLLLKAKAQNLARSKAWLSLLHMQKTMWGGYLSEARDSRFLLSNRRDDPEAELKATLESFFKGDGRCRFPARFLYLSRALGFSQPTSVKCEKFDQFHDRIGAHSVAVVFSSYYLNNPSSAFGHSFLRLSHDKPTPSKLEISKTEKYELLDYGVGYAANTTTGNPIFYAIYGLFGFFQGSWTSLPYYYKVREYNDFDSRDLWSYTLNLSQDEIEMLVAHLWELGQTTFNYFYFTRNCSYEILAALEAAKPDLNLLERLHTHVIPSDTIKTVYQTPGLVSNVTFRPSIRSQLFARWDRLKSSQQDVVLRILKDKNVNSLPASASDTEKAEILDAALDGADFQEPASAIANASTPLKSLLLRERSRVPVMSDDFAVEPSPYDRPHLGHGSHRLGIFGGSSRKLNGYGQLNFRFAHHDFADQITGYPDYANIEFFSFLGRYNEKDRSWWLEDMSIFHVISLSPWNSLKRPISWEVKLGSETVRDGRCHDCGAGLAQVGGGLSAEFGRSLLASVLVEGQAWASPKFSYGFLQISAGPKARVIYRFKDRFQAVLSSAYFENIRRDTRYSFTNELQAQWNWNAKFGVRVTAKNISGERIDVENEAGVGGLYYF
jgi:hypothetical protein